MRFKQLRRIGGVTLTVTAAVFFLLWALMAILLVRSYWRSDHIYVSFENRWFQWSSASGQFYEMAIIRPPEDVSPFDYTEWSWSSGKSPLEFAEAMERRAHKYGSPPWRFLGFQHVRGDPSRRTGRIMWRRFVRCPMWPFLLIIALLPACWLWRFRSWPRKQRRTATRCLLLTSSIPVAISVVLLVLLFVNAKFMGPEETPLYGRTSHPSAPLASDADGVILRIMTYNIWMGGAYRGGWRFEKPECVAERVEKIGELIRQQQPDIVFLQEVAIDSGPGSINQVPVLAEKIGMHVWSFGQCINDGLPFYRMVEGNAILSRWPVEPLTNQKMAGDKSFYEIGRDDQSTLWCKAHIGRQEVLLASVHLTSGDDDSGLQVEQLLDFAGDSPAIMAGDFNAEPNELEITRIIDTGRFGAKLDGSFTISSYDPHTIIDYIFVPRQWQLLEHRVIQTDLSDHLPVVATYRIPYPIRPDRAKP